LRPVATEKAMKKMEEENTMVIGFKKVFICGLSASKN
jgi:ribosomal protein L23